MRMKHDGRVGDQMGRSVAGCGCGAGGGGGCVGVGQVVVPMPREVEQQNVDDLGGVRTEGSAD